MTERTKKLYINSLTAASIFAGDSSFGLDSIDIMLSRIVSTYKKQNQLKDITF